MSDRLSPQRSPTRRPDAPLYNPPARKSPTSAQIPATHLRVPSSSTATSPVVDCAALEATSAGQTPTAPSRSNRVVHAWETPDASPSPAITTPTPTRIVHAWETASNDTAPPASRARVDSGRPGSSGWDDRDRDRGRSPRGGSARRGRGGSGRRPEGSHERESPRHASYGDTHKGSGRKEDGGGLHVQQHGREPWDVEEETVSLSYLQHGDPDVRVVTLKVPVQKERGRSAGGGRNGNSRDVSEQQSSRRDDGFRSLDNRGRGSNHGSRSGSVRTLERRCVTPDGHARREPTAKSTIFDRLGPRVDDDESDDEVGGDDCSASTIQAPGPTLSFVGAARRQGQFANQSRDRDGACSRDASRSKSSGPPNALQGDGDDDFGGADGPAATIQAPGPTLSFVGAAHRHGKGANTSTERNGAYFRDASRSNSSGPPPNRGKEGGLDASRADIARVPAQNPTPSAPPSSQLDSQALKAPDQIQGPSSPRTPAASQQPPAIPQKAPEKTVSPKAVFVPVEMPLSWADDE